MYPNTFQPNLLRASVWYSYLCESFDKLTYPSYWIFQYILPYIYQLTKNPCLSLFKWHTVSTPPFIVVLTSTHIRIYSCFLSIPHPSHNKFLVTVSSSSNTTAKHLRAPFKIRLSNTKIIGNIPSITIYKHPPFIYMHIRLIFSASLGPLKHYGYQLSYHPTTFC